MWLRDAVMSSHVPDHYFAVWPRDAVPVQDISPLPTRVSSNSVVSATGYMTESRGFKSHLELGILLVDVISKFNIIILYHVKHSESIFLKVFGTIVSLFYV